MSAVKGKHKQRDIVYIRVPTVATRLRVSWQTVGGICYWTVAEPISHGRWTVINSGECAARDSLSIPDMVKYKYRK